ncbi:MAG: hypothetical protein U0992_16040 [Planctomycetaceae bacterium]
MRRFTLLLTCAAALWNGADALAQGLVWNLPDDGTWVRYEGTYQQVIRRPQSTEGDLTLEWQRNLEIKSVGREDATHDLDHDGKSVTEPCRWLEFKVVTGKIVEGIPDAGPGATVIYKVLVPESAIDGKLVDDEGILKSYIPVVKGFRKLGDEPAQALTNEVLQVYPNLSLLRHYRELETAAASQTAQAPKIGEVTGSLLRGQMAMETGTQRSKNQSEFLRSPQMPFGLVSWKATTVTEQKNLVAPRSQFQESMTLTEQLTAVDSGAGAESELVTE